MRSEEGYAAMEAFLVGLVLIVPLIWALTMASALHRSALASASAVREAGLAASRAATASEATSFARSAVSRTFSERGVDPSRAKVSVSWGQVLRRGAPLVVNVQVAVPVARIPFTGTGVGPVVWVRARHVSHVEPYRSTR